MSKENQETETTAESKALPSSSGSRLDYTILPRHLKGVCKCNGFPLSEYHEALIYGCMAAIQMEIEEHGLAKAIEAFSPANNEFTA